MPQEMRSFVTKRTKQTNHATPTEYIRSLVRDDQKRAEQEKVEKLLIQGLESGEPIELKNVDAYFAKKKALFKSLQSKRRAKGQ